jgi:hypothetical protein
MAYFEDSVVGNEVLTPLDPGQSWDGFTIAPFELGQGTQKIMATTNRDILCTVAGLKIPFDSLTIGMTEAINPVHGASRARGYALAGGDLDYNYSVEFGTWIESSAADALRNALFTQTEGRAVYHTIHVYFLGDPAKGGAGAHKLLTLGKCKAKADSWTFGQGGVNKGKFEGLALDYEWYGK